MAHSQFPSQKGPLRIWGGRSAAITATMLLLSVSAYTSLTSPCEMIYSFRSGATSNSSGTPMCPPHRKWLTITWDEWLRKGWQGCKQAAQRYPWDPFLAGTEHCVCVPWGRVIGCAEHHSLPGLFPSSSESRAGPRPNGLVSHLALCHV